MSLFATFEALPFLSEGGSFVVGQGSLGTGMSRGKIHGIWVLCKTLLPLLFGGSLVWVSWIEVLSSSKISLVGEIFAMLMNSSFNPVFEGLVMTGGFKSKHRLLQSLWESLEVSSTYHSGLFVVAGQLCQLLELGCILVQFPSFHLELEELLFGSFPAHNILEILGEVIDHSIPDPFVGVSSPSSYMAVQLCRYLFDP